jgi:GntR family transcriptional repressor for pyruvate dehydrogenase complex
VRPAVGLDGPGDLLDRLARKRVADLFEARQVLEPAIAATVAERGAEEDFVELESVVERLRQAATSDAAVYATAADFHRVLASATGNQVFERMVDSFFDVLIEHGVKLDDQHEHKEWEWRIHRDLLAVLRQRDPDLARAKMVEHLHESFQSLDRIIPR